MGRTSSCAAPRWAQAGQSWQDRAFAAASHDRCSAQRGRGCSVHRCLTGTRPQPRRNWWAGSITRSRWRGGSAWPGCDISSSMRRGRTPERRIFPMTMLLQAASAPNFRRCGRGSRYRIARGASAHFVRSDRAVCCAGYSRPACSKPLRTPLPGGRVLIGCRRGGGPVESYEGCAIGPGIPGKTYCAKASFGRFHALAHGRSPGAGLGSACDRGADWPPCRYGSSCGGCRTGFNRSRDSPARHSDLGGRGGATRCPHFPHWGGLAGPVDPVHSMTTPDIT